VRFSGSQTWRQAGAFFVRNAGTLAVLSPLLVIPFLTDALTATLIDQERREGQLRPGSAIPRTLGALPAFVRLKIFFFARATLWSLVPIYGLIRDVEERLAWAMSSNVVALEGRRDFDDARGRCQDLVATFRGECVRTLITMPCLLAVPIAIFMALVVQAWMFWVAIAAFVWLWLPGSAAANTYLYLWMREQETASRDAAVLPPDTPAIMRARG
jgi:hypothetical protein